MRIGITLLRCVVILNGSLRIEKHLLLLLLLLFRGWRGNDSASAFRKFALVDSFIVNIKYSLDLCYQAAGKTLVERQVPQPE
jgi:hypothetical protein